jgi:hypothetical protein
VTLENYLSPVGTAQCAIEPQIRSTSQPPARKIGGPKKAGGRSAQDDKLSWAGVPYASSNKSFSVGLCFSAFDLRFLSAGSARVGGGVPIALRAAAFTAEAALNGFGLRGFEGTRFSKD